MRQLRRLVAELASASKIDGAGEVRIDQSKRMAMYAANLMSKGLLIADVRIIYLAW